MKNIKIIIWFAIVYLLSACGTPALAPIAPALAPIAPNVAAVYANQTAQAAQQQADTYNAQSSATAQNLTATAYAPLAQMTQAAAELQIQNMYAAATTISAAQTQTAYANQQSFIAQSTSTAGVATQVAQVTEQAFNVKVNNDQLALERAQTVNQIKAWSIYAIGIVLLILSVARAYVWIRSSAFIPNPIDERGKPQPMIEVVEGIAWDIDRAVNGVVGTTKKFLKELPEITAERQDQVTTRAQLIDMQVRRARLPKALLDSQAQGQLKLPAPDEYELNPATNLALPPWEFINDWDGDSRPLGFGSKGLITAAAASPHLLVSGKTGTGKTGFMLRTQATASLAKGYQVINLGFSDSGFGVFNGHPNYHSVKLDQASDIIACLASVYKELKERKQLIGGESIEWDHWPNGKPPRPFVDLLIDELGNIAEDIYASEDTARNGSAKTKELWRWISMIANEGRKVGIRFVAALQDPTAKSVDLRFRRNCTLVSFQQGDASQSSAFLGAAGAERLQVGHFMARIDSLIVGGGFSPSDVEIKEFLSRHAAEQTPAPQWIEGVIVKQPTLPVREPVKELTVQPTMTKAEFVNGLSEWETEALSLYEDGLEQKKIVEKLFAGDNPVIGKVAVADLIQRWDIVKGVNGKSQSVNDEIAHKEAEIEQTRKQNEAEELRRRTDEELEIKLYHEQGLAKTNIVYKVWGNCGGTLFNERMARVKEVLGVTATSLSPEKSPEFPINGALAA